MPRKKADELLNLFMLVCTRETTLITIATPIPYDDA